MGSDLVVAPEMAATGYLFPDVSAARQVAEPPRGPTFAALAPIARRHGCWIVCGFAEDAGDVLYNSALLIDPRGELAAVYRKILLFEPDHQWACPGDAGVFVFDCAGMKASVGICMDLNNPYFTRWLGEAGIELLAFPTNWLDQGTDVHAYWHQRLAGTPTVLVGANRYGVEDDTTFSGRSAVLDAERVWATGPRRGDAVVRAVLSATAPGGPAAR